MKKIQLTLSVRGRSVWSRNWYYVPRVGEYIKGDDGEWYEIDEISWHTPSEDAPREQYAMASLDLIPTKAR